jgi:uncharacterized membrane protein
MSPRAGLIPLVTICIAFFYAPPASAAYLICNKTSYVLYGAVAAETTKEVVTKGWTRVLPGSCETALKGALKAPAYYTYARSSNAHQGPARAWGGEVQLCAKAENFSLHMARGAAACPDVDSFTLPFAASDTHGQDNWTSIFTESAAIPTMEDAATAGLQRLLADNGYKTGAKLDAALAEFRKRLKLSPRASQAQMFTALEREAEKSSAPEGYAVCNETKVPFWAAIAYRASGSWVSRGWWKVAPASCARATESPLPANEIFLLVEKKNGKPIVSGKMVFCISDVSFDVTDRGRCKTRGLKEAGFAATKADESRGYAARVGDNGLIAFKPSLKD